MAASSRKPVIYIVARGSKTLDVRSDWIGLALWRFIPSAACKDKGSSVKIIGRLSDHAEQELPGD